MTDFRIDVKQLIEKLTSFKLLFLYAFILILGVFSLYNYIINERGKNRLSQKYELRTEYDQFDKSITNLEQHLNNTYINALQYYLEDKDMYRFQAISEMGDANMDFNEMYRFVKRNVGSYTANMLEFHQQLQLFEEQMLQKLNRDGTIPELEFQPLIIDDDTTNINVATAEINETEDATFVAEDKQLNDLITRLFELNALISNDLEKNARKNADNDIYHAGLFWVFVLLFMLTCIGLYIYVRKRLNENLHLAGQSLQQVSKGTLPDKISNQQQEFSEVFHHTNAIVDYLNHTSEFALKIGEGEFEYDFKPKSEEDTLGNALIQMRSRLQEVAREDNIRNWMNEGHARLSDILRASSNEFEKLGDNIIAFMTDYLEASMGALYILNEEEDEPCLELLSVYAFNRKKHEERKLKPGEGLAGQAYIERKSIFIKEVKTDHFNIVTGLGESKPASVFIVPLKEEESIEGVLELASFKEFEEYEREFIERLTENIANAIKSGKDNETTKKLLAESQQKEEEMKAQEEELRQNMEELAATQEQVDRLRKEDETKKKELEGKRNTLYEVLNHVPDEVYLKDENGKYVYVNKPFALAQNKLIEDFVDKTDFDIYSQEIAEHRKLQEKQVIDSGESHTDTMEFTGSDGKKVEKQARLSPFYINYLQSNGVLGIVHAPDHG